MIVETITKEGLTLNIETDDNVESPRREFENIGRIILFGKHKHLGDDHNFSDPDEFRDNDEYKKAVVVLPVFLYEHSGITISTKPFSCPWDSGQVGWIVVSKEKVREGYMVKNITKKTLALANKCLEGEIETLDQYLQGDVYGYSIEDEEEEVLESCWGFYGLDNATTEAKEMLDAVLAKIKEEGQEIYKIMHL